MAQVLVLQHSVDDPSGYVGAALVEAGHTLVVVRCDRGEQQPQSLSGYAGLLVLGGAMGAYDDDEAPWLPLSRTLLREAAGRDLPTLAICLGHQLLAVATEGRVASAALPQVGLHPLRLTEAGRSDPLLGALTEGVHAVHWNNDLVVELPPGASVLATTDQGVQAMRLGSRVWGLQFHPEVDVETVTDWARADVERGALLRDLADARLSAIATASREQREVGTALGSRFARLLDQEVG